MKKADISVACVTSHRVSSVLELDDIQAAQQKDPVLMEAIQQVNDGCAVSAKSLQKVKSQLKVSGGLLVRSVKVPPSDIMEVPVLLNSLEQQALEAAHLQTGHGSWESSYQLLRSRCYFPDQATKMQRHVQSCGSCRAANDAGTQSALPSRPVTPCGPWQVVQIDTLELGPSRGRYHCVLVCCDVFTKWAEVTPLKHHNAKSVAEAFVKVCARWGAPAVVRSDNGTEFVNAIVEALLEAFGVAVKHGAVRHPQSQGAVERFNRILLTMLRKLHDESLDWKADLALFLHCYRVHPHGVLKISPAKAMLGWEPRSLVVSQQESTQSLSEWSSDLERRAAAMRDYVEEVLSALDFVEDAEPTCSFSVGDTVQLRNSSRSQKLMPAFQRSWTVKKVLSGSTVVVRRGHAEKVVNVDLIKPDVPDASQAVDERDDAEPGDESTISLYYDSEDDHTPVYQPTRYNLRNRAALRAPAHLLD